MVTGIEMEGAKPPAWPLAAVRRVRVQLERFVALPTDKPELLRAQYLAFSRQMPMMYVMMMTNTWAVAYTHLKVAPLWIVLVFPAIMTVASLLRAVSWARARGREPSLETAARKLGSTNVLAFFMASGFVIWAIALFPHGDAYAKAHLAFFLATTIIGCIICLMHLRSAALIVTIIVAGGFVLFFGSTGEPTLVASAVDIGLVSIVLLAMLATNYRDFTNMIEAQVRTEALSNENLRLANLDSLTELPNRRAFFSRLEEAVKAAQASGRRVALGIIDLDGFKPVNDLYGHPVGDRLLAQVSRRLAEMCPPETIHLSRLGGDEFAMIITDAEHNDDLIGWGDALCRLMQEPFALPEATVQIGGSIGLAVYPEMADSADDLFERADYALYRSKRLGRGAATLFSAGHNAEISRGARIEQALKMADLEAELDVVFQPIVDARSGSTLGFEALARWNSPALGAVPPSEFIPVAERTGVISHLTRTMLEKALAIAAAWPAHLRLSFNLSSQDIGSTEGMLSIIGIIGRSGFPAGRLDIEVTESAFGHDFSQVQQAVDMLKRLGCGISLDDFGTGYSSLSRLHALPLTKIKIDRSFVTDLHRNPASLKIVKSLLALSRDMGLDCIVEGVETEQELAALRDLGGVFVQGYFYSPPVSADELRPFLAGPQLAGRA